MIRWLILLFVLSPALRAAEPMPTPEVGVVEVAETPPEQDEAWNALLLQRGSADWPAQLQAWLKQNPHGRRAAQALIEEAALEDDLTKAAAALRLARGEASGTDVGSAAALELARLDYAQERTESALATLDAADDWPKSDELQPEWLYWKAQCRFVLKGFQRARDDFQQLAAGWPKHPRAQAALLGQAECDSVLKAYDRAEPVFKALAKPGAPFAAQALWGWAGMKVRQGDTASARQLYTRLKSEYPASFEAGSVDERLAALPTTAPIASPTPVAQHYAVQVGAFSHKTSADKLAAHLRQRRYPAQVQVRRLDGRTLYLVKVGPYKLRSLAQKQALRLEAKEKLPQRIIEE